MIDVRTRVQGKYKRNMGELQASTSIRCPYPNRSNTAQASVLPAAPRVRCSLLTQRQHQIAPPNSMRSVRDMRNLYQHAPEVSFGRTLAPLHEAGEAALANIFNPVAAEEP